MPRKQLILAAGIAFLSLPHLASGLQQVSTFLTGPLPIFSVGSDSAGPPASYFNTPTNALRMQSGNIVVGSCLANEIRMFSGAGAHLKTVSLLSAGGNPTRYFWRIMPAGGDSLVVHEGPSTRVSLYAPDLTWVRWVSVPERPEFPPAIAGLNVFGRFSNGAFVGRESGATTGNPGVQRVPTSLFLLDGNGALRDSLAGVTGQETEVIQGTARRAVRLARTSVFAMSPDRLYVGTQNQPFITEYGADLRPIRRIATATLPAPVTDSVKAAWVDAALRRITIPRGGIGPAYGTSYSDSMAAYGDIVAGDDGRLWVQNPARPGMYPLVWSAYRDGRRVALLELPPRFFPTQFGADWVLGIYADDRQVRHVRMLKMVPGFLTGQVVTPQDGQPPSGPRCGIGFAR